MSQNKSNHKYRINIELGMRVMIKEGDNSKLLPCYVKEIVTSDTKHESGIKVICEDGKTGRVKYIGTESSFLTSDELLHNLEKKLRKVIVKELSEINPNYWNDLLLTIKSDIEEKLKFGDDKRKQLGIPDYELIEETNFYHLPNIILGSRWKYFEKIFKDKNTIDVKLHELALIRNPSAHSNTLPEIIEKKIQVYYDDIIRLIEDYERKSKNI